MFPSPSLLALGGLALGVGAFALLRGEIGVIGKIKLRGKGARIAGIVTLLLGLALLAAAWMLSSKLGEW